MPLSRLDLRHLELLFKIQKEIQLSDPGVTEALFIIIIIIIIIITLVFQKFSQMFSNFLTDFI